jgi:tRNA (guanine-N7-)-methyltransferase
MGRRALRKIDPSLDLSAYFLQWEDLPSPFALDGLFDRAAPLEIEVGSGKGLFLETASAAQQDHDFLGIEISRKYARYTAARLAKGERANAKVLHGDGLRFFAEVLPAECLVAVHVYFPDPWWKKRHHKRRVMTESFIQNVHRVLVPDGRLHFWTDVEDYFQATLELIAATSPLQGPMTVHERPAQHDLDYRTHFERRMRLHDAPVYRSQFRK